MIAFAVARESWLALTEERSVSNAPMSDRSVVAIVISAEPLNDLPAMLLAVARVVAVSALPVTSPVKSPVNVPSIVPALKSSNAEPCLSSILSALALYWNVTSSPEPPSSVRPVASKTSEPLLPVPRIMFLSSIARLVVSRVVVVPLTVRLPVTTNAPDVVTVTSVASPIVTLSVICGSLAVRFDTFTLTSVLVTLASFNAVLVSSFCMAARIVSVAAIFPPVPLPRFVRAFPVIAVAAVALVNAVVVANELLELS